MIRKVAQNVLFLEIEVFVCNIPHFYTFGELKIGHQKLNEAIVPSYIVITNIESEKIAFAVIYWKRELKCIEFNFQTSTKLCTHIQTC